MGYRVREERTMHTQPFARTTFNRLIPDRKEIFTVFTIRPFDYADDDYEVMYIIDRAIFPQYEITTAEWKHIDESRDPKFLFRREMIALDGDIIAFGDYGQSQWSYHPDKYFFNVFVHPDHEHPKVRKAYLGHVLDILADRHPIAITSGMLEDKQEYIRFFTEHGFTEIMRTPLSQLDVATFDASKFVDVRNKVREMGVQIVSLCELPEIEPDWKYKLYELDEAIRPDVPTPESAAKRSFENFEKAYFSSPNFMAASFFVALDNGQFVGMAALRKSLADEHKLLTGLTGVVRSHRRRGIATALKARAIEFARQYGAEIIETANEENNPMFDINMLLGFKPKPAWVQFEKPLRTVENKE
jgi:GNAT superfamily N-acetyltransferase